MINKVLKMSKSLDDEKVGVSFQMPKSLKNEVDKLCEENGIKLTTFFNSLAQVALDEHKEQAVNYSSLRAELLQQKQFLKDFDGGDDDDMIEYYERQARMNELDKLLNKG